MALAVSLTRVVLAHPLLLGFLTGVALHLAAIRLGVQEWYGANVNTLQWLNVGWWILTWSMYVRRLGLGEFLHLSDNYQLTVWLNATLVGLLFIAAQAYVGLVLKYAVRPIRSPQLWAYLVAIGFVILVLRTTPYFYVL